MSAALWASRKVVGSFYGLAPIPEDGVGALTPTLAGLQSQALAGALLFAIHLNLQRRGVLPRPYVGGLGT